jgi:hypothetical protein
MRSTLNFKFLRIGLVLALVGSPASAPGAQAPAAESGGTGVVKKISKAVPAISPRVAAKPESGQHEGIRVHGDWTIVIRNKDGSVAARHEFKNKLVNFGLLPQILAHRGSAGRWSVSLEGDGTNEPCSPAAGPPTPCMLAETTAPPAFGTLSVSDTPTELILKGTVKAVSGGQIRLVRTALNLCSPTQPPSITCTPSGGGLFTEKDVTSLNILVNADQTLDVTVKISFS